MNLYVHHLKIVKVASVACRAHTHTERLALCVGVCESCHKQAQQKGKLGFTFIILFFHFLCAKSAYSSLYNYNAWPNAVASKELDNHSVWQMEN